MKEIVVISGKGGTGKTSLTASFAILGGTGLIVADCDVDAANMHLLLQPDFAVKHPFSGGHEAVVNADACTGCGRCREVCRFDAIGERDGLYSVDPLSCEGCGYCARVCPTGAITMQERITGDYFISTIKTGARMVHARMGIGAENSGKLVARVKKEASDLGAVTGEEILLVDGAPGIGCPVISSLSGAGFVVLVTEPTISGIHDLKRIAELLKKFRIKAGVIINKAGLNTKRTRQIETWMKQEHLIPLGNLPYTVAFTQAMTEGKTIMEWNNKELIDNIKQIWQKILNQL
jgi:MinD superfamily P-loop ATPase